MDNFDPYDVFLAITTNIPQRLKTAFVLQGHVYLFDLWFILQFQISFVIWHFNFTNK